MLEYYHGTSDKIHIDKILRPPYETGNLREVYRIKYRDKVFFTNSIMSAQKYAKKAVERYGGNPVVYLVKPIGDIINTVNNEYISDRAIIVATVTNYTQRR